MNSLEKVIKSLKIERQTLNHELEEKQTEIEGLRTGFESEIEKKDLEIEGLEETIAEYPNKDEIEENEEMTEAIRKFCFDCPVQDNISKCQLCYLNKWKLSE